MTTDEAVALWKKEIEPLKRDGLALVSPAVTNGVKSDSGAPMGVPWLKEFIAKCSGCSIDGVALRNICLASLLALLILTSAMTTDWYDSASHVDYFTSYLQEAHDSLKLPIYLTEVFTSEIELGERLLTAGAQVHGHGIGSRPESILGQGRAMARATRLYRSLCRFRYRSHSGRRADLLTFVNMCRRVQRQPCRQLFQRRRRTDRARPIVLALAIYS